MKQLRADSETATGLAKSPGQLHVLSSFAGIKGVKPIVEVWETCLHLPVSSCGFWTAFVFTSFQSKTFILEQKHITKGTKSLKKLEHGHCEAVDIKHSSKRRHKQEGSIGHDCLKYQHTDIYVFLSVYMEFCNSLNKIFYPSTLQKKQTWLNILQAQLKPVLANCPPAAPQAAHL